MVFDDEPPVAGPHPWRTLALNTMPRAGALGHDDIRWKTDSVHAIPYECPY